MGTGLCSRLCLATSPASSLHSAERQLPVTPHVSACLVSRGTDSFPPRPSFRGCLQGDHLGRQSYCLPAGQRAGSLKDRHRGPGFASSGLLCSDRQLCLSSNPPRLPHPASPPWALGCQGHGGKHKPHATCCAVTKSFVSDPSVPCLLPASVEL